MRWFSLLHAGSHVSCTTLDSYSLLKYFGYGTFTLCRVTFQSSSPILSSCYFLGPNPKCISTLGLGSCNFARHYSRNHYYFLFLWLLRCFSSPGSPHYTMYSCNDCMVLPIQCFHIRIPTDHSLCATPRRLSQLVASFFGA